MPLDQKQGVQTVFQESEGHRQIGEIAQHAVDGHIAFRNSRLARFFRRAVQGAADAVVIVNVLPASRAEELQTIELVGQRVEFGCLTLS